MGALGRGSLLMTKPFFGDNMKKRSIILDIGFSPGDICVFTAALRDLCEQYPDFDISVNTCCPAIFENNPHLKKKPSDKKVNVNVWDNLLKIGYTIDDIKGEKSQAIFNDLMKQKKLRMERVDHKYQYIHIEKNLILFDIDIDEQKKLDTPEYYKIKYEDIHKSGWSGRHFSQAFYIELKEILGVDVEQTSLLPDIHLSKEEKGWMNQVEETFGYKGKFWLFNCGTKSDYPAKQWPIYYWQNLIDLLEDKVQFVQVGELAEGHDHRQLRGVLSLVGKTDLRELIRLSYHAEGGVSHVSLLHHLMAAWQKPTITLAGGREPRKWESYPMSRYMDTNGLLPCSSYNGCWKSGRIHEDEDNKNEKCVNMVGNQQRCMMMIKPEMVAREIEYLTNNGMPLHAKLNQEIKELKLKNKIEPDKLKVKINEALIKNLEKKREGL